MTALVPLIIAVVLAIAALALVGAIPALDPNRKLALRALVILLFIAWLLYRYSCYLATHGCGR